MSYHWRIRAPQLYVASLTLGTGPRLLLGAIVEATLKHRQLQMTEDKLAALVHRCDRTVRRWIAQLVERRWVRVIRRGKKMPNVYRLTLTFWRRLTGQGASTLPREVQASLYALGLKIGVDGERMRRAGVRGG